MSESSHNRLPKRLRWAGRIIGLLASVGWLAVMTASSAYDLAEGTWEEMSTQDIVQGALIAVIAAIALAGCIVSWWRERTAALLLALASAGMGTHIALIAGRNHFLVWTIMGLPFLVAGVLLFVSWRLTRRA